MSILQYSRVWETFHAPAAEKLAALAIADWADDDGRALVTPLELAAKIRVDQPEAARVMHRLLRRGFMTQTAPNWFQIAGEAQR